MCTAVLTHFPIDTETRSRVIQVYVSWYLSRAPHTLDDTYTHLCVCMNVYVGTYAFTVREYSHVLCLALVYFPKYIPLGPGTPLIVWQGQLWPPIFSHSLIWCSPFTK